MKRLDDLTKRERRVWLNVNGVRKNGNIVPDASAVKFIIENNSKAEITEWLRKATTIYFDASCAPFFCSVFEFNRLNEYVNEGNQ